jgi:hypothetical protein
MTWQLRANTNGLVAKLGNIENGIPVSRMEAWTKTVFTWAIITFQVVEVGLTAIVPGLTSQYAGLSRAVLVVGEDTMGVDPHAQPVEEQDPLTYKTFETTRIQEQLQRLPELVLA